MCQKSVSAIFRFFDKLNELAMNGYAMEPTNYEVFPNVVELDEKNDYFRKN